MTDDGRTRERLLVVELRMLGDAVLSMPFLRAAKDRFDLTVCCTPVASALLGRIIPPQSIVTWEPPWLAESGKYRVRRYVGSGIPRLARSLRGRRFDLAVCAWADPRSHALMSLAGARRRLGFPVSQRNYLANERQWRRRQMRAALAAERLLSACLLRPLLTEPLERRRYDQHHIRDWAQIADALGLEMSPKPPWFSCESKSPPDRPAWAVHGGGRLPSKRWPVVRFQRIIDEFFEPSGIPVAILSHAAEDRPEPRSGAQKHVETPTIDALVDALSGVDCVLCNDSLVSHLAAAMGKRVVTVFGSGNPDWFAPRGSEANAVCSRSCPHHPCMDRCVMPSYVCLESVSVEQVARLVAGVHEAAAAGKHVSDIQ